LARARQLRACVCSGKRLCCCHFFEPFTLLIFNVPLGSTSIDERLLACVARPVRFQALSALIGHVVKPLKRLTSKVISTTL
jgi:hypothetical protein